MKPLIDFLYKNLFAVLLAVGVVFSFVTRALLEAHWENKIISPSIATLICLLCLSVYFFICKKFMEGGSETRSPDNLYYMGLLFTLCSLTYSLITLFLFNEGSDNVENRVYNLIGSFGIALVSTVFGILFRILLLQTASDPFDLPGQALAETTYRLREELTQTISAMTVFRTAVVQAGEGAVRETTEVHTALQQQIRNTSDQFITTAKNIGNSLDSLDNAVNTSSERLIRNVAKMETTFGSFQEPLNDIVLALRLAAESTHAVSSDVQRSIALLADTEGKIEAATSTLTEAMRQLSEFLEAAAEVTPQLTRQFEKSIEMLRLEAQSWEEMTGEVRSSLAQAMKDLTHMVKREL